MTVSREDNNHKYLASDICKGIAIFLLITGSFEWVPAALRIIIYSVNIPLFLIAEGAAFERRSLEAELKHSLKAFVKPYFIISIIAAAFTSLLYTGDINSAGYIFLTTLDNYVVGMSNTSGVLQKFTPVGIIWLLLFLFAVRAIYAVISSICKTLPDIIKAAVVAAVAVAGWLISHFVGFLPWSVDAALTCTVFMAAGEYITKLPSARKAYAIALSASLIVWGALIYNYIQIDIQWRRYPYAVLCFVCSIAGCTFIFAVSKLIAKIPFISSILSITGKNWITVLGVFFLEQKFISLNAPLKIALIVAATVIICCLRKGVEVLGNRIKEREEASHDTYRLDWPDVAKGICMISIILGHLLIDWINQIVFLYDLPVFFLIAGFFLKKKSNWSFIKSKAKRLLIPYYVTCLVIIIGSVINACIDKTSVAEAFTTRLSATLYAAGDSWQYPFTIYGIGAIWFFWALFIALVITNLLIGTRFYKVLIPVIAFIGWISFYKTNTWLPLSIQAGMLASLYLLIGYEAHKKGFDPSKLKWFISIPLLIITAAGMQHFKGFWLVHNYFGNGWIDFFVSIVASLFVISVSVYVSRSCPITRSFFRFFGKNSLIILCFHMIEMAVLPLGEWNAKLSEALSLNALWSVILLIVLKIAFCAIAVSVWNALKKVRINSPYSFQGK